MQITLNDSTGYFRADNGTDLVIIIKNHVLALKAVLLVILLIITLAASLSPFALRRAALYSKNERQRHVFVLAFSHLSCFGGGVFLATCLLDLLPDTQEVLKRAIDDWPSRRFGDFPLAEFLTAFGFFLILFCEQIFLWFKELDESRSLNQNVQEHSAQDSSRPAKRIKSYYLNSIKTDVVQHRQTASIRCNVKPAESSSELFGNYAEESDWLADSSSLIDFTAEVALDVHFDPEAHSTSRTLLLLAALSLHSIFEGLALGLQTESGVALQIFTALSIHKSIIAFSIGLQLVQSKLTNRVVASCCLLFSLASPLGGALGLAMESMSRSPTVHLINGCMQGVACGTFLYITSFEILPHELNEVSLAHRYHRLSKLLALVAGFAVICVFVIVWP